MLNALIERAKSLILKPAETWDVIAEEEADVATLYKTWIIPLAAIAPAASLLAVLIAAPGRLAAGLGYSVILFGLALGSVYAFALIVDALAPSFGAEKNFKQAFKLAAYSPAATWVAGVFALIPALSWLWPLLGLYSLYLVFVGLPKLMKPAEDKGGVYTLASLGVMLALWLVIGLVTSPLLVTSSLMFGWARS